MPARVSWQDLLKVRKQAGKVEPLFAEGALFSSQPAVPLASCAASTQPAKLTLHLLLKNANPSWTAAEFKAAKKKLKTIGIESYSEFEEVLLQSKSVLNNRLKDHGLKSFASSTLERLKSTVIAEQEGLRQATDQEERLQLAAEAVHVKLQDAHLSMIEPPAAINSRPFVPMLSLGRASNIFLENAQNTESSGMTLYVLLKTANPGWTTKDLDSTTKKLKSIGIVTYTELEEVLLQGRGILNKRLRDNGLKVFAPSTLQRLKSAVKAETPRQQQVTLPLSQRSTTSQRSSPMLMWSQSKSAPQVMEMAIHSDSDKDSDDESVDDGMGWYDDHDNNTQWNVIEQKLSDMRSSSCKVRIAPLDLSKALRMNLGKDDHSARTESTAIGTTPGFYSARTESSGPCTPLAYRAASVFSIGTP